MVKGRNPEVCDVFLEAARMPGEVADNMVGAADDEEEGVKARSGNIYSLFV